MQAGPSASWTKFHRNLAAGQVKRMWVPVSGIPHMGQSPSPGPCRLRTSTPEGRRSLRSCHTKILIFSGMGAFKSGEVQALTGVLKRLRYADFTENVPDGVRCHDTRSRPPGSDSGSKLRNSVQAAASAIPNVRRNEMFQVPLGNAEATSCIGSAQIAKRAGNLCCSGLPSSHGSSQNRVFSPLPMEKRTPFLISCLMDWIDRQNWDPSWRSQEKRGRPCRYFALINCSHSPPSSLSIRHTHRSMSATFILREEMIPMPPISLGVHTSAHLTM